MTRTNSAAVAVALLGCGLLGAIATASAASMPSSSALGFQPMVPVSALARPAAWFDPSRLKLSTSVTVGSGFNNQTQTLQVTSLGYQFAKPLWLNVSVGNAWGAGSMNGNSSPFLEGLDLGYRPFSSMEIQVHYRDFRSPLQYAPADRPFGWGY